MRHGDTLKLGLAEPEFTEQQLREAHAHLRIKRPFEDCMQTLWMPPLLRCCARDMARRAARRH
ncbi:MAG: hypothetical protein ACK5X3_01390 [Pseudomonadota bacterium]|nr:hypothetical protein [Rhodocyclaceae bacterium]